MSKPTSKMTWISTHKLIAAVVVLFVILIIIGIIGAVVRAPETKQPIKNGQVTLIGELVCLPHKNTDGPQTLECAAGFKTTDGSYYALRDETPGSTIIGNAPYNKRVEVRGILQTGNSDQYQSKGTITVQTLEQQ